MKQIYRVKLPNGELGDAYIINQDFVPIVGDLLTAASDPGPTLQIQQRIVEEDKAVPEGIVVYFICTEYC